MTTRRIPIRYASPGGTGLALAIHDVLAEADRLKGILESELRLAVGRCPACGGREFLEGRLHGSDDAVFQPDRTEGGGPARVPTHARTCKACGYIQLKAEVGSVCVRHVRHTASSGL